MQLSEKAIRILGWVLTGAGFAISIADSELTRKERKIDIKKEVAEEVAEAVKKLNK